MTGPRQNPQNTEHEGNLYPDTGAQYDERGDDIPEPDAPPEILSPTTPGLIHMEPDSETEAPPPSGRRAARAAATQALYEAESAGHPARLALEQIAERDGLADGLRAFAVRLVEAVESTRLQLDERIAVLAPARPVARIDRVDRTILRLALAELSFEGDGRAPAAVIANEAVEIAKLYGSETSPRFINGVLGTVLR
ncbi:MAG: transcription antitermination factor NusB [Dehalococcoidia bacterium]|nr:transcription antitermination factor NusB [Dehalococcoidia bacterium]